MRGFAGWLMLLPLAGAAWLIMTTVNACVEKGRLWRWLGALVSLLIGGICIRLGYTLGFEGFSEWRGLQQYQVTYPVLGWIWMVGGGLLALLGTWVALSGTKKKEIEGRE